MLTSHSLKVGQLSGDEPMQVVSGRLDKPKVHFEVPPRDRLAAELIPNGVNNCSIFKPEL